MLTVMHIYCPIFHSEWGFWHMGGKWFKHHGGNYLMEVFHLKLCILHVLQHLVVKWHEVLSLFLWAPSSNREHCNSMQNESLMSSILLCCMVKRECALNLMACFLWGLLRKWGRVWLWCSGDSAYMCAHVLQDWGWERELEKQSYVYCLLHYLNSYKELV